MVELSSSKSMLSVIIISLASRFVLGDLNQLTDNDEFTRIKQSEVQLTPVNGSEVICGGILVAPSIILTGEKIKSQKRTKIISNN